MGYLMTTLSAPEDLSKSKNVAIMLSGSRSSFTLEDDLYQAQGLETIKAIIGQFLTNQIELDIQEPDEDEFYPFEETEDLVEEAEQSRLSMKSEEIN